MEIGDIGYIVAPNLKIYHGKINYIEGDRFGFEDCIGTFSLVFETEKEAIQELRSLKAEDIGKSFRLIHNKLLNELFSINEYEEEIVKIENGEGFLREYDVKYFEDKIEKCKNKILELQNGFKLLIK